MPDAAPLAALRQSVDRSPHRIKRILMDPAIRRDILGGVKKDEKKATHTFVAQNAENALKTKPKVSNELAPLFVTSPGTTSHCAFPLSAFLLPQAQRTAHLQLLWPSSISGINRIVDRNAAMS